VTRSRCILFAAFLAGGSTQCLLYTDSLNVDPEVTISTDRSTFMRNEPAQFTAVARDPDQSSSTLALAWFERPGSECPRTPREAADPAYRLSDGTAIERQHAEAGAYCLWVIATDQDGATALATRPYTVTNRAPVGVIAVEAPQDASAAAKIVGAPAPIDVALFSEVRLSAAESTDPEGDKLTYRWRITLPDGTAAQPQPCTQSAEARVVSCYVVVTPGLHRFELDVSDGSDPGMPVVQPVMALEDAAPCVVSTTPAFGLTRPQNSEEALTLKVDQVTDDGDPFPPRPGQVSQATFTWYSRKLPATTFERWKTHAPWLDVPANHARPGDVIEFRLQYGDRVKDRELGCDPDALNCPPALDRKCHQWVGWTVVYKL
jgi:hypothetical protein